MIPVILRLIRLVLVNFETLSSSGRHAYYDIEQPL